MKIFNIFSTASLLLLIGIPVWATQLNLYDQPKKDSKVVGTVDSEVGIIPIFNPKEGGDWVKVADPRNGNVGWITSNDLKNSHSKGSGFSFRVITTGEGPNSYQIVQFGAPKQLPSDQAQAIMKKMEVRQQELQKDMQKMMKDLFDNTQMNWPNFPIVFPVVMVPEKSTVPQKATTKIDGNSPPKVDSLPKK